MIKGYLNTSTSYFSTWKRRYFILKNDNILYHYSEKGGELKGKIHLAISQTKNDLSNDRRFEIDSGLTSIAIKAENKEERDSWINKIKLSQQKHEAFEKDFLKKTSEIFQTNDGNSISEEIENFQSKLEVICMYTRILEEYNQKISEIATEKNSEEKILSLTKKIKV